MPLTFTHVPFRFSMLAGSPGFTLKDKDASLIFLSVMLCKESASSLTTVHSCVPTREEQASRSISLPQACLTYLYCGEGCYM